MYAREFCAVRHIAALGLIAALASSATNHARAAGFALREGSADWMANAFAGSSAKAYDASTAWSNPAGMALLQQSEIDGSINGIFPSTTFSGANFTGPGQVTPGSTGGNLIENSFTPGLYGVWNATPDLKFGLGVDSPFGQRLSNPGDFVGRYHSLVSSISDVQFAISAAYKINEQWSIGGGPVIDYLSTRLTQALPTSPLLSAAGDPDADLHAQNIAAGFNIGVLFRATPSLRFGLDYRSRIEHDISGTQSIYVPPALNVLSPNTAAFLRAQNSPITTQVTLPDSVTGGFYWEATSQLAIMSDITWTDWSLIKTISIIPSSPTATATPLVLNWRNTIAVSVGANYKLTRELMLQGGIGFDQSPVTNSNRTSRIPDSDRYLIGVGAQYDVLPNLTLQVAYAHVFFASAEITSQASPVSGVLVGKYSVSADTASLGAKYRF
jgi:long-chain fatty acid transport protein